MYNVVHKSHEILHLYWNVATSLLCELWLTCYETLRKFASSLECGDASKLRVMTKDANSLLFIIVNAGNNCYWYSLQIYIVIKISISNSLSSPQCYLWFCFCYPNHLGLLDIVVDQDASSNIPLSHCSQDDSLKPEYTISDTIIKKRIYAFKWSALKI